MQRGQVVKIRAGQMLEVKRYHGSPGILDAAGRARGRIKCWQKWSFPFGPLGPDDTGPPAWTVVYKRRRMSRFRRAAHGGCYGAGHGPDVRPGPAWRCGT